MTTTFAAAEQQKSNSISLDISEGICTSTDLIELFLLHEKNKIRTIEYYDSPIWEALSLEEGDTLIDCWISFLGHFKPSDKIGFYNFYQSSDCGEIPNPSKLIVSIINNGIFHHDICALVEAKVPITDNIFAISVYDIKHLIRYCNSSLNDNNLLDDEHEYFLNVLLTMFHVYGMTETDSDFDIFLSERFKKFFTETSSTRGLKLLSALLMSENRMPETTTMQEDEACENTIGGLRRRLC